MSNCCAGKLRFSAHKFMTLARDNENVCKYQLLRKSLIFAASNSSYSNDQSKKYPDKGDADSLYN